MAAKKRAAAKRPNRRSTVAGPRAVVLVENFNHPGASRTVDAASYQAMRRAVLKVLPLSHPGFTYNEIFNAMLTHLPADLFPDGAKAGWWLKTVQLDLEAKDLIRRAKSKPLRWHRVRSR